MVTVWGSLPSFDQRATVFGETWNSRATSPARPNSGLACSAIAASPFQPHQLGRRCLGGAKFRAAGDVGRWGAGAQGAWPQRTGPRRVGSPVGPPEPSGRTPEG